MTWIKSHLMLLAVVLAATASPIAAGCGDDGGPDEDLGPIDDPNNGLVDFGDRINWPGIDQANGRVIPFIRGFGEGVPAAYWFLGFASRRTADSFWFCREGDDLCPLDEHHRLNWDHLVGHPLFTRIPGLDGFSPFWQMWKVEVPADYEPDSIKTTATLEKEGTAETLTVNPLIMDFGTIFSKEIGPREVILHCALILTGSTLAENGELMPDGVTPMMEIPIKFGWHEGYKVEFVDFSVSDGVFPAADDSENRPLMPKANIYIQWRECTGDPMPEICNIDTASVGERPVSERGLGQDITGDGDDNDTNNTVGAIPCREPQRAEEPVYSPLWAVNKVKIHGDSGLQLIDDTGDQRVSDINNVVDMFQYVADGLIDEPEPQTEDSSGNPVPGNDGQVFFSCPNPVEPDYVPFPCSDNNF